MSRAASQNRRVEGPGGRGRGGDTLDAATIIEAESRELIRRRGLDVHADQLEPLIREVWQRERRQIR